MILRLHLPTGNQFDIDLISAQWIDEWPAAVTELKLTKTEHVYLGSENNNVDLFEQTLDTLFSSIAEIPDIMLHGYIESLELI